MATTHGLQTGKMRKWEKQKSLDKPDIEPGNFAYKAWSLQASNGIVGKGGEKKYKKKNSWVQKFGERPLAEI